MFTAENGKKAIGFIVLGLITLAIHQKFIAPMLVKKPAPAKV